MLTYTLKLKKRSVLASVRAHVRPEGVCQRPWPAELTAGALRPETTRYLALHRKTFVGPSLSRYARRRQR